MENNAVIRVSGLQRVESTGENVEMLAKGKHYIKNNKHYLMYEEIDEDSGVTSKNTIKFNETSAEVLRRGMINGKLVFSKGDNNQSLYSTPYGDLLVEIFTRDIELTEEHNSIKLKIDYELYANNSKVSDNKIEIDINQTS